MNINFHTGTIKDVTTNVARLREAVAGELPLLTRVNQEVADLQKAAIKHLEDQRTPESEFGFSGPTYIASVTSGHTTTGKLGILRDLFNTKPARDTGRTMA